MSEAPANSTLVYISHIVTPHQVKFCDALQKYMNANFWFYESAERTRGAWWDVSLGAHCRVLDTIFGASDGAMNAKYIARKLTAELGRVNPDVVMLGGFSVPSNYIAYRWARKNGKKTVVFTERSRDKNGKPRRRGLVWAAIEKLYRDVDLVLVSAADIVPQFRDEFRFGDKVVESRYPTDIDDYFQHPVRTAKDAYTYLFANRLTDIYNPLGAIDIFAELHKRYPGSRLLMNARGELAGDCRRKLDELGLQESVEFLDKITAWSDLSDIYRRSDILLLPAHFSNGNYTIIEAMASGMGVIVSEEVLGIGKYIVDGVNGFNCQPDTATFVERVERYIADPGLFSAHQARNRTIAEPLTASGTAKHLHELFKLRRIIK